MGDIYRFFGLPSIEDFLINILNGAIKVWNDCFAEIARILTTAPQDFRIAFGSTSPAGTVWPFIVSANGYFQAIGAPLMVIFFFTGVVKTTTFQEIKRPESAVRMIFRFIIGQFIVTQGFNVTCTVFGLMSKMTSDVLATSGVSLSASIDLLPTDLLSFGFLTTFNSLAWLLLIIIAGIAALVIIVLAYVILLSVYARFFKLYVYAAFSPIPLASFGGDQSTWSIGQNFIKSFLAVMLEGVVVMLSLCIFAIMINTSTPPSGSGWGFFFMGLLLPMLFKFFLLFGTLKVSSKLARELLGLA